MTFIETPIPGVWVLEPRVHEDQRGYFFESYLQREFEERIGKIDFVQDNQSKSAYGVMRGLHFQRPPFAQAKLVRCTHGRVLDIALDLRKASPTYGKHFAIELSEDNHLSLYMPHGIAHGFSVLSPVAIFQYKCDNYYCHESEGGISLLDPALGIDWKIPADKAILSEKDTRQPLLAEFDSPF